VDLPGNYLKESRNPAQSLSQGADSAREKKNKVLQEKGLSA